MLFDIRSLNNKGGSSMEVLNSSRFWIAALIIVAGTTMAIIGVAGVAGMDVITHGLAILAGFGVAKTKKIGGGQ
jgi:hypothetical protein